MRRWDPRRDTTCAVRRSFFSCPQPIDVTGWGDVESGMLAEFCEPEFDGQFAPVSNVIIRNLTFRDTLGSSSDARRRRGSVLCAPRVDRPQHVSRRPQWQRRRHRHLLDNYLFNDASVSNRTASYFLVAGVESNVHAEGNLIEHARETYVVGEESSSDALLTFADSNRVVQLNPSAEALFQIESNGLAFDPASFYPYAVEDAAQLATTVPAFAGAGKL